MIFNVKLSEVEYNKGFPYSSGTVDISNVNTDIRYLSTKSINGIIPGIRYFRWIYNSFSNPRNLKIMFVIIFVQNCF